MRGLLQIGLYRTLLTRHPRRGSPAQVEDEPVAEDDDEGEDEGEDEEQSPQARSSVSPAADPRSA